MSAYAVIVSSIIGLVSIFLSWYSVGEMSIVPWEVSTGKILLVLAVVALIMGVMGLKKEKKAWGITTLIMGILFLLVVFANYPSEAELGAAMDLVKIEPGFYLSMVGGILMTISGIWKTMTK